MFGINHHVWAHIFIHLLPFIPLVCCCVATFYWFYHVKKRWERTILTVWGVAGILICFCQLIQTIIRF